MDELGDGRNNLALAASHQTEVSFFLLVLSCRVKKSIMAKPQKGWRTYASFFTSHRTLGWVNSVRICVPGLGLGLGWIRTRAQPCLTASAGSRQNGRQGLPSGGSLGMDIAVGTGWARGEEERFPRV